MYLGNRRATTSFPATKRVAADSTVGRRVLEVEAYSPTSATSQYYDSHFHQFSQHYYPPADQQYRREASTTSSSSKPKYMVQKKGTFMKKMRLLPENERLLLLQQMKKKWDSINAQIEQAESMAAFGAYDTLGRIRRTNELADQLEQIENTIHKLAKKFVFVNPNDP
mmetsp:Transcript_37046/g.72757  ORF Transcript_37046/g.72757 Transcript_37046/m.72757 type:complete len:167 (-) Transcript_37046:149-649(-)